MTKYKSFDEVRMEPGEYHEFIQECPFCKNSMHVTQYKNDVVKERCIHCGYNDEYCLM